MKLLYLVRCQYSRCFLREVLVVLEIAILLLMAAPLTEHWMEMSAGFRLFRQLKEDALFFQRPSKDGLAEGEQAEWFRQIEVRAGANRVGCTAHAGLAIDGISTHVFFYNEALLNRLDLPVQARKDQQVALGEEIPILVSSALEKKWKVGDRVIVPVLDHVTRTRIEYPMCVVGVLRETGAVFDFSTGASEGTLDLSSLGYFSLGEQYILALSGFEQMPAHLYSPSCLLFTGDMSESEVQALLVSLEGFGVATPLQDMEALHRKRLFSENVMLFVAPVIMLLVTLMGVCIYVLSSVMSGERRFAVYYLCGMDWRQGLLVQVLALLPLLLLGIAITAVLELCFNEQVAALLQIAPARGSTLLPLSLVIASFYLIGTLTAYLQFKDADPLTPIRKGE